MTPKLVRCLFASMLVGSACAGGVVAAGGGLLFGLLAYSLIGSTILVPFTLVASRESGGRRASVLGPFLMPTLR